MGDLIECNLVRIIHECDEKMAKGIYYFSVQEADLKKRKFTHDTLWSFNISLCSWCCYDFVCWLQFHEIILSSNLVLIS